MATPGITPWARASPMNDMPRTTTHDPVTEHTSEASSPASRARWRNS